MNRPCFVARFIHCPSRVRSIVILVLFGLAAPYFAHCDEIHRAARDGCNLAEARRLLSINQDLVFRKDDAGMTALHYAAFTGCKDVMELLLANKAEVDAKDNTGKTPLHYAADAGHKDVAELLLISQANVNARDNLGITPLEVAVAKMHNDMAELLRRHGGLEFAQTGVATLKLKSFRNISLEVWVDGQYASCRAVPTERRAFPMDCSVHSVLLAAGTHSLEFELSPNPPYPLKWKRYMKSIRVEAGKTYVAKISHANFWLGECEVSIEEKK